jgi:hypothetical protein
LQKQQLAERQQQQQQMSTSQRSESSGGNVSPSSSSTEEHSQSQSPSSRLSVLEEVSERGRKEVANFFNQTPPAKGTLLGLN